MNILQVGENDLVGHRFNGHDLNQELRAQGHHAEHLVWSKVSDDPHTHEIASQHPQRMQVNHITAELDRVYNATAIFPTFSYELLFHQAFLNADVVNYHLIHNGFTSLAHLPILTKLKPAVWTLHDPWALTGHCVHPFKCERWKTGCGQCQSLDITFPITQDTTALNWEIKKQFYAQCDLDLIVASRWMEQRVKQSPLLQHARVHYVRFGVDTDVFAPGNVREARQELKIDPDSIVLGLRAIKGEFKGLGAIIEMLEAISSDRKITLLTFNKEGMLDAFRNRFDVRDLRWVQNDEDIVRAYNATDLFLMPSQAESFGMMAMEAMACGVPSVVMSETALEETVFPEEGGGVVVPQGDQQAFNQAVQNLIDNDEQRRTIGAKARELACKYYEKNVTSRKSCTYTRPPSSAKGATPAPQKSWIN